MAKFSAGDRVMMCKSAGSSMVATIHSKWVGRTAVVVSICQNSPAQPYYGVECDGQALGLFEDELSAE